jgi:hypothetical protein
MAAERMRYRRVFRDNFNIDYRILSLIVADSNVSLCHSSIHAPLIHGIKQQVDSLVRHAVMYCLSLLSFHEHSM